LREEFRGRVNDTGESGGHVGVLIEPRAGPVLVPGKEGRKGGREGGLVKVRAAAAAVWERKGGREGDAG